MNVHISELHTDVVGSPSPARPAPEPSRVMELRWHEARARNQWLADRTRAEGFDD